MNPETLSQEALRAFFDCRHPQYVEMEDHWRFLEDTYSGGRQWFEQNLFPYVKEGPKEFEDRKKRAYRFNHTKEVVQLVLKYLFKGEVKRNKEQAPDIVKKFWKKSMLKGFDIQELMKQVGQRSSVGGRTALVVDNNFEEKFDENGNKIPSSIAENDGTMIYAYAVPTSDILDYAWDEKGDGLLLWIKLREWYRDDTSPFEASNTLHERVRLWTRDGWFLFEEKLENTHIGGKQVKKIDLIDSGTHSLNMVPVRLVDNDVSSDDYKCPGLIDDIAYLDRAVANYLSNLDAIIQDQTFSQLAIPAQSIMRGDNMYEKVLELGTKRIFVFDSGAQSSAKPEYLSPDPKQASIILTVINKIINEVYHSIGLAGERTKEDNAVGIDNSSGVAKAYDFERVNSLLMSKASICEAAENWMVKVVLAWGGEQPPQEDLVSYPETFDIQSLADEFVNAEALAKIEAPDEMRREHLRTVVDKLFPQLKTDVKKRILDDIKAWKATSGEIGNAQNSAATPQNTSAPVAAKSRQGSVTADTPE